VQISRHRNQILNGAKKIAAGSGDEVQIGSLCSGVGGLELGLEWAGLGETAWQVEADPFCRRMLGKHWPHARQFEDVREVGRHNLSPVALVCFGFPCQDVSAAGAKAGLGGARSGLFYECARVVAELDPAWVVVENVASGARLWVDAVVGELERLGYACVSIPLSAGDCGALHPRARVFVVAHIDQERKRALTRLAEVAGASAIDGARAASDADGFELRKQQQRDPRRRDALQPEGQAELEFPGWRAPEPPVVRVANGVSGTLDGARVRALGNAVVPQSAEVIGWVIRELLRDEGNRK